jgi:hypothetical protein
MSTSYSRKSKPDDWVRFTKRTDDPKLRWLEITLSRAGIQNRRNGFSFHAPILEILARDWEAAWAILTPIDDVPDDDPRWLEPFDVNPSGRAGSFGWHL